MKIIILLLVCLLFSCTNEDDMTQLDKRQCNDESNICLELTPDSYCQSEYSHLVEQNSLAKRSEQERPVFYLFLAYEEYAQCIEPYMSVRYIKNKKIKNQRIKNSQLAKAKMSEIAEQTQNSDYPGFLYLRWMRYNNKTAKAKLIALETSDSMKTMGGQYLLGTLYQRSNVEKSINFFKNSLKYPTRSVEFSVEIMQSIIGSYLKLKKYPNAYTWMKVLQIFSPEHLKISEQGLEKFINQHQLNEAKLDKLAHAVIERIETGYYRP